MPVAGLLAETARTLRAAEFAAVRDLAAGAREDVEDLLLSADRFLDGALPAGVPVEGLERRARRALLDRFGLHGLRLATTLVRRGAGDSAGLAAELVRRSGLEDLRAVVGGQLVAHGDVFRARAALGALERVLRAAPRPRAGGEAAAAEHTGAVERVLTGAHELVEQDALVGLPVGTGTRGRGDVEEARRLLGGDGAGAGGPARRPARRGTGRPAGARARRPRPLAPPGRGPRADRARTDLARIVVRSVEGVLAGLTHPAAAERPALR